jgi:hypothetical protein
LTRRTRSSRPAGTRSCGPLTGSRCRPSADRRRKLVRLTARGTEALALSADAFEHVRARWAALLGADRVAALEADLRKAAPGQALRLDIAGWLAG